jgi:hypothetical protein
MMSSDHHGELGDVASRPPRRHTSHIQLFYLPGLPIHVPAFIMPSYQGSHGTSLGFNNHCQPCCLLFLLPSVHLIRICVFRDHYPPYDTHCGQHGCPRDRRDCQHRTRRRPYWLTVSRCKSANEGMRSSLVGLSPSSLRRSFSLRISFLHPMRRDLETPHVSIFGVISCRAWSLQMLRPSYNLYHMLLDLISQTML